MKLSVIIVNYNVRAYLEQCLRTVFEALQGIDGDVFVVDNQSTDGSVEMVRGKFPQVKLIANTENVGFSRANNQAIRESKAEYVLLLNPDTVVGEDVFRTVLDFLDAHPKAGGLGVKMIDGTGQFLPESKRGLPTPGVAFYKIIGLTRLFPRSRVFGRYHMGHLPEDRNAPIEILSGACMFLRKRTLDEVGLLDENFFMYGEDIDLSYRITLGGYENWYLPEARIIHYKGESTKKSSVNYVFVFYNAMAIFAKKHFTRKRPDVLAGLINASIYLSAAGAIVSRFLKRALLPMFDAILLVALSVAFHRLSHPGMRPDILVEGKVLGIQVVVMLVTFASMGAYDLPVRLRHLFSGSLVVFLVAGPIYGLLSSGPEWSVILYTAADLACVQLLSGLLSRMILHLAHVKPFTWRTLDRKRVLAIGSDQEVAHAFALLWQTHFGLGRQRQLASSEAGAPMSHEVIRKEIRKHGIDEVVFCAKDLKWGRIIELMERLKRTGVMFKIAQPAREFIIGPNSIESVNDLLILEEHAVNSAAARRRKRVLDIMLCVFFLVTFPVGVWFIADRKGFLINVLEVIRGERSWVGYTPMKDPNLRLPRIRPGVLDPVAVLGIEPSPVTVRRVNLNYAKDYRVMEDLRWVMSCFSGLGRRGR